MHPFTHPPNPTVRQAMEQQPFVDRHWLYYNRLHRETVLEYFAQSRFYDRASCNEELRMQGATVRVSSFHFSFILTAMLHPCRSLSFPQCIRPRHPRWIGRIASHQPTPTRHDTNTGRARGAPQGHDGHPVPGRGGAGPHARRAHLRHPEAPPQRAGAGAAGACVAAFLVSCNGTMAAGGPTASQPDRQKCR